jgi:alpha-galactosidase/6-phospho-beta-glucosidase family protein|tara:strand:+ start:179 stop:493 length:315 start_codon:yes stop_codon:yes gene_type:complete
MYYVVHETNTKAKTFSVLAKAKEHAQYIANTKKKRIEIDKVSEVKGQFSGQTHHTYIKPSTRRKKPIKRRADSMMKAVGTYGTKKHKKIKNKNYMPIFKFTGRY